MDTKEIEESIQRTIEYFDRLSNLNPALKVREYFRASLITRLEKFLDGNAKGTTKAAVKDFFRRCADDCLNSIEPSLQEACDETKDFLREAVRMVQSIKWIQLNIEELKLLQRQKEAEIEALNKRIEELSEMFPDEKARTAYEIYTRVSESDKFDDSYTKQCRIRQAGLMAAAYLGLQRYEINPQTKPTKND